MEETKINEILISLGFGLPQSPDEIKAFDDTFKSCKTESNPDKIDSFKILEDLRPKKKQQILIITRGQYLLQKLYISCTKKIR